jgi:hypothetical protein
MDGCAPGRGMAAKKWVLVALIPLSLFARSAFAEPDDHAHRPDDAQLMFRQRDAAGSLTLFRELIAEHPSFPAYSGAARASAAMDQPQQALRYYRRALPLARDPAEQRIALFGIARVLMWLERYREAESVYADLLSRQLPEEDRSLASAGLLRSLSFQDKPMRAYRTASTSDTILPAERLERARAALWAGWPDRAAEILDQGVPVEPGTRMAKELGALQSEIRMETANPLDFHVEATRDSDDLRTEKSELGAAVRPFPPATLGLLAQHQRFEQRARGLTMKSLQVQYVSRGEDVPRITLQAGPAAYGDWHTALWSGNAVFRPDDETRYEAFVSREAVETFEAFDRHIRSDTAGLGVTYRPAARLVLAASLYRQTFSDDNRRLGESGTIGVPVSKPLGLGLRLSIRHFSDSRTDTVGYFNPDRFSHGQLLLALTRHLGRQWQLYAAAGPGRQRVTAGDREASALAEISIRGMVSPSLSIGLDGGYSSSAIATSSGYRRQYAGVSFSLPW